MISRFISYIVLVLLVVSTVIARQVVAGESSIESAIGQNKKESVSVDEPPAAHRQVGQAEINYYAGSDTTEVRTEWPVYKGAGLSASMWFVATGKGKGRLQPKSVAVNLGFSGEKVRLAKLRSFALELDGREVNVDDLKLGDGGYDLNAKRFFQTMRGSIPFETFQKLVESSSIKVQSGDVLFELSKRNHDALRDVLSSIEEKPGNSP
jgi:hypothetical protein